MIGNNVIQDKSDMEKKIEIAYKKERMELQLPAFQQGQAMVFICQG